MPPKRRRVYRRLRFKEINLTRKHLVSQAKRFYDTKIDFTDIDRITTKIIIGKRRFVCYFDSNIIYKVMYKDIQFTCVFDFRNKRIVEFLNEYKNK